MTWVTGFGTARVEACRKPCVIAIQQLAEGIVRYAHGPRYHSDTVDRQDRQLVCADSSAYSIVAVPCKLRLINNRKAAGRLLLAFH